MCQSCSSQERLSEAENEHLAELRRCENEKVALQTKLDDVVREAEALTAQVEALQADRDFSMEQLAAMKCELPARVYNLYPTVTLYPCKKARKSYYYGKYHACLGLRH